MPFRSNGGGLGADGRGRSAGAATGTAVAPGFATAGDHPPNRARSQGGRDRRGGAPQQRSPALVRRGRGRSQGAPTASSEKLSYSASP